LKISVMTTSPSASSCGAWALVVHHTMSFLIVSSFFRTRSIPPGDPSTSYTFSGGTPSAINTCSNSCFGYFRNPRRPGHFFVSNTSAIVFGPSFSLLAS
jgi:hypothetical protein